MFLLIFATAVGTIAAEFGFARWEDLMPYGVGAFVLFGLGSLPAGRLGDLWGRRRMMLVFFFGIGASALLVALTRNAWQLAAALTLLGAFASIYHPVGIPMLVQHAPNPGATIGVNGLAGNLGIAVAALITGFLVKWIGWRAAFAVPGLAGHRLRAGVRAAVPAARPRRRRSARARRACTLPPALLARVFAVMTAAAVTGSLLFNFTTNGNAQLLAERFRGIVEDPAMLGVLLAAVYARGLAGAGGGRPADRPRAAEAAVPGASRWRRCRCWRWPRRRRAGGCCALLLAVMIVIFGAIPFTDAMIVRYVDDRMRSRVAGMRLTVSIGISSLAVWLLGPVVKAAGFDALLLAMAGIAIATAAVVNLLPGETGAAPQPAPVLR